VTPQEIYAQLSAKFGDSVIEFQTEETQNPTVIVSPSGLEEIFKYLKDEEALQFDSLMNLAGHDPDPESELVVIYHLHSIELDHYITIKTFTDRESPKVDSVANLYGTADWHEREAYDLFGIIFEGHPDLKRILMEEDWEGFPLKKDYVPAEFYRGMRIAKEK